MTTPRPRAKCARCGDAYRDHPVVITNSYGAPVAQHWFVPRPPRHVKRRVAISHPEAEVALMADLLAAVSKRDTRTALAIVAVRQAAVEALLGKVRRAKARMG